LRERPRARRSAPETGGSAAARPASPERDDAMTTATSTTAEEIARRVLATEAEALGTLAARLPGDFAAAVELVLETRGRVIVSGMGKSGHVGRKIAATLW
jgi:DNA-binding MurR/RpiR family transcriptional regulator